MLVEKKVFALDRLTLASGAVLEGVRVGWESYGRLNADRSNAILITHFFSGTSHAAGRYDPADPLPGYWDPIIGPGKAIDTDRFFVLSSDTLVNLNANMPNVVTTGPSSADPTTGRPYGPSFPIVTFGDFVAVQAALLESLGIGRLKAVAGPSMGALQAFQWAATHPERVERIVPVIGGCGPDAMLTAWLDAWAAPIRLDPNWRGGDYYGGAPHLAGLTQALKLVTIHAQHEDWANATFGAEPALASEPPASSLDAKFRVQAALDELAATRAALSDANNMLYLVKANQLSSVDPTTIRVPTLLVGTPTDLVFPPERLDRVAAAIRSAGTHLERATITGPYGHLNGLVHIGQAGPAIAAFLDREFG